MESVSRAKRVVHAAMIVLVVCTVLPGCSSYRPVWAHRSRIEDYSQRFLSLRTTAGAEWLEVESDLDATVRHFVAAEGRPDYLYVVDTEMLHLFYLDDDLAASFERGVFSSTSEVTRHSPIPKSLARFLPLRARQRIASARKIRRR
ncbi:MAG: hypothetical protein JRH17_22190 [Deltaproteobacteria bacterium]|nr:hypothetical protein [Deltaproteobacteria bacterium]MBW2697496.1 hypothetical protein [Deltaproteobacteria bacterium]